MKKTLTLSIVALLLLVTILSVAPQPTPTATAQDDDLRDVTLFLSFIPSVQFAPMYVALENDYFADNGINIEFEYSFDEAGGVDRIALNDLQFGIVSGEQVLLGRGVEKPLVYVMEWYNRFPVGVVVPADSDIETPADLDGRNVSIPALQGASYIGILSLLESADLTERDLQLVPIGFSAPEAMCAERFDAATVYVVNEPLTISQCYDVRVIPVADYANLVANGLVTNETTIENNPELVRGMVNALVQGIADTVADPETAFDISLNYVDLPDDQLETQRQVLLNSVELWQADIIGQTDPDAWEATQAILLDADLLRGEIDDLDAAYTNEFIPEQDTSSDDVTDDAEPVATEEASE
jgi:NitT/TauT family transport system substrate-binding protein